MRLPLLFASFYACLIASSVYAQDAPPQSAEDEERARIHFQSGRTYFEDGAYERAAEAFESAYALSHHAELLMNIASSFERLGRSGEAADMMERYLAEADPADVEDRGRLERRIANLRARAASGDGGNAEGGGDSQIASGTSNARTVGAVVSFSVAGVGLAAFGVLGALALSERSSLENGCGAARACVDGDVGGLRGLSLGADIGLVVAGVGAITGLLVLLLLHDDDANNSDTQPVALLAPWVGANSAGLAMAGRL